MSTRIIRITACAQCPKVWWHFKLCSVERKLCPPTGTPAWCPLEVLEQGEAR